MPATPYLLALDQGTSSSRSIVFDAGGRIRGMAQREIRQIYPQSGWVEHDPRELWDSQLATARQAMPESELERQIELYKGLKTVFLPPIRLYGLISTATTS